MRTIQSFPTDIKRSILVNQLIQPGGPADVQEPTLDKVIELIIRSVSELGRQGGGRDVIWNTARAKANDGLANGSDEAANLVKTQLEDRYHGTMHGIDTATGAPAGTAVSLLYVAAPVAFSMLGEQVAEHNWDAEALNQWLQGQRSQQLQAQRVPLPMPLATAAEPREQVAGSAARPARRVGPWIWAALLVAVSLGSYWLGTRSENRQYQSLPSNALATTERFALPTVTEDRSGNWNVATPITTAANENFHEAGGYPTVNAFNNDPASGGGYVYGNAGVPVVLKLAGGLQQIIGANSTESKLYQFLANPNARVDTLNPLKDWIGFDRIYFESSKATLTNESMWQLSNVASILKTFPNAEVRIGGYTDSSGNPELNLKLSRERAQAARDNLISMGVTPDHIEATGYGSLDNIASNATPDGRSLNRRVSVRVTKK